jgi:hypothetical protein
VENLGRRLEDKPPRSCAWKPHHPHRFEPTVYTALPSSRVVVKGVVLQPSALAAALISVENRGTLPPGSRYTFQVQQWIGATLVGGSAYEVRIAGEAAVIAGPQMPEDAQLEIEETQERFLPPWIVAQA